MTRELQLVGRICSSRANSSMKVVSLFTGAGGLDLGLHQVGFASYLYFMIVSFKTVICTANTCQLSCCLTAKAAPA